MRADFFNSLPKPGQFIQVPGGVVFCESWEVNHFKGRGISGAISFRFEVDADYAWTAIPTPALPERVRELPAPPLALMEGSNEE